MYELDDGLLSPEGSEVQCARCQHVFTVRPPQAPGRTLQGVQAPAPAAAPPAERPAAPAERPAPAQGPASGPAPATAPVSAPRRPAVYRPPVSQPSVPRASVLRRDTVGTFESRLRWSHRWRWLAPAVIAVAVAAAGAVILLRESSAAAAARRFHAHALALALADDVQSLEAARAELDRAVAAAPRMDAARADRALVDLLLAGELAEVPADGADPKARRERASALVAGAGPALDDLARVNLARAEVARARAVAGALAASRTELRGLATAALAALPGDPWVTAAEASVDVRSTDRTVRDRALGELVALAARRPDALRARYLLARGQALAGRHAEALATLTALLMVNPRHDAALALREAMAHPPAGVPVSQPVTAAAPADKVEKATTAPRKADSTEGDGDAAPRPEVAGHTVGGRSPPAAAERPGEVTPAAGEAPVAGGGEPAPAAEAPPPPRLRPAAVPEPEPVREGG